MKINLNIICLSLTWLTGIISVNAAVITVTCQNNPTHFLPVTVNAVCGDTIHWTWADGGHEVGPVSPADIPAGAAMWFAPIDGGNLTFDYVVTVAGNYHYVCHPFGPHGEDGYIVVTCATGVESNNLAGNLSSVYPNPFSEKLTIETFDAELILIYNVMGEEIKSFSIDNGQTKLEADLAALPKGIFFFRFMKDGAVVENRKIIKR